MRVAALSFVLCFGMAIAAAAQGQAGQVAAESDFVEPLPRPPARIPATGFLMPDLPDALNKYTSYDGRLFSTHFNFVWIFDYNAFDQDDTSIQQVGAQADEWDNRTMRLMFRGRLKSAHPIDYFVSLEVKGHDHFETGTSRIGFVDLELSTALGKFGSIKYGKVKEPFVYEMVGDAANLQEQERALNPFFVSRGIGTRWTKTFAADAMTLSAGWFNDWWLVDQKFNESGNDFAARFTGVPYWADAGANYLHLGISARYVGAEDGSLRFRGRPESNVSAYYVDSEVAADHANLLGGETVWGRGPLFVTADVARAWVDADAGDPQFWGSYVVVSYVLTGEHRPYDKSVGYARRIQPQHKAGAWEIVGRYSHVDVDDAGVDGGTFDRVTAGINWWATRRWKLGFDYGRIRLDRFGVEGLTHAFHTRAQWLY